MLFFLSEIFSYKTSCGNVLRTVFLSINTGKKDTLIEIVMVIVTARYVPNYFLLKF